MKFKQIIPFFIIIIILILVKVFTPAIFIESFLDYISLLIYILIAIVAVLVVELMIKDKEKYRVDHHKAKLAWIFISVSAVLLAVIKILNITIPNFHNLILIKNFKILVEFIWLDAFWMFYKSLR